MVRTPLQIDMLDAMEQLIPEHTRRLTEQEYLRMEELAQAKHEFRHGKIIDMAGGTGEHAGIASNFITELGIRFKDGPCKAYGSDLRLRVNESGSYCYPDVTVVCGPLEYAHADRRTTIVNPRIIIEVTSQSTETEDRGDKFNDYRRIESLREYVLVSQDRYQVETYYRQDDGVWAIGPAMNQADQTVALRSRNLAVPLREIYAGVELPVQPVLGS